MILLPPPPRKSRLTTIVVLQSQTKPNWKKVKVLVRQGSLQLINRSMGMKCRKWWTWWCDTNIYTCNGVKIRWYRYQLLKTNGSHTHTNSHLFVCYKWQPLQGLAPAVPVDNKWTVCSTDAIVAVYPTIFHHSLEHNVRGILPYCPPPPSSPTSMLVPLGKRNSSIHPLTCLSTNHLQKQKGRLFLGSTVESVIA